jgi:hypothetical protein
MNTIVKKAKESKLKTHKLKDSSLLHIKRLTTKILINFLKKLLPIVLGWHLMFVNIPPRKEE